MFANTNLILTLTVTQILTLSLLTDVFCVLPIVILALSIGIARTFAVGVHSVLASNPDDLFSRTKYPRDAVLFFCILIVFLLSCYIVLQFCVFSNSATWAKNMLQ